MLPYQSSLRTAFSWSSRSCYVAHKIHELGPGGARAGRVELDFDLGLGVGGLVVEVSGLVVPIADGGGDIWEKCQGTVERLDVADVAVFIDGG